MTAIVTDYLDGIERRLLLSSVVLSFQVREREERPQEGFIHIRAALSNGDILEAFEFVISTPDTLQTLTYRIHWQQGDGQLKRRWDNAPHHVHIGPADHIESSEPITILQALAVVEREIQGVADTT